MSGSVCFENSSTSMSDKFVVYARYEAASQAHTDFCLRRPGGWHPPDVAQFSELKRLLLPHAEAGDTRSQYAVATILFLGLCCESEEQYVRSYDTAIAEATPWWTAAAKQGYWPALDSLLTCGVGTEAERLREASNQLRRERPDLIGHYQGVPSYGDEFMQELSRRIYGGVVTE
jgi:hypothetical protein